MVDIERRRGVPKRRPARWPVAGLCLLLFLMPTAGSGEPSNMDCPNANAYGGNQRQSEGAGTFFRLHVSWQRLVDIDEKGASSRRA